MDRHQTKGSLPPIRGLEDGVVHLWMARLDLVPEQLEHLSGLLSKDEIDRASRFRFARDREHFIAARAILRQILSRYIDRPANALHFSYAHYGKPELDAGNGRGTLDFNLSHAGGMGLYAVSRDRAVGVDVEYLRKDLSIQAITHRFFSRQERASLEGLSHRERNLRFFTYWTRKEAFLKALGRGLSFPLEEVDVSGFSGHGLSPLSIPKSLEAKGRWFGMDIRFQPGYAAAVVAQGDDWRIEGPFDGLAD